MIVIPMAGLSKRFLDAGYTKPKYMLPLGHSDVFSHSVGSFSDYFRAEPFLFVVRDVQDTVAFVEDAAGRLGIAEFEVACLDRTTSGQAETVELGLHMAGVADSTSLLIFNIDTFRPNFRMPTPNWLAGTQGYLEVFKGSGANWSFVKPRTPGQPVVQETAEKRQISDLCSTGVYWFETAERFRSALSDERASPSSAELFVAPLYNHLIRRDGIVKYDLIDRSDVIFCGVPDEYEDLKRIHG